jgi:hypothetical protein
MPIPVFVRLGGRGSGSDFGLRVSGFGFRLRVEDLGFGGRGLHVVDVDHHGQDGERVKEEEN